MRCFVYFHLAMITFCDMFWMEDGNKNGQKKSLQFDTKRIGYEIYNSL